MAEDIRLINTLNNNNNIKTKYLMHPCVAYLQISLGAAVLASATTGRWLSSEIDNTSKGNVCRPQQQ